MTIPVVFSAPIGVGHSIRPISSNAPTTMLSLASPGLVPDGGFLSAAIWSPSARAESSSPPPPPAFSGDGGASGGTSPTGESISVGVSFRGLCSARAIVRRRRRRRASATGATAAAAREGGRAIPSPPPPPRVDEARGSLAARDVHATRAIEDVVEAIAVRFSRRAPRTPRERRVDRQKRAMTRRREEYSTLS
eukprot:29998-Pelagococcus_subviridis.AAC.3